MPTGPKRWFFDGWSLFYDLPWVQRTVYRAPQDAVITRLGESRCRTVLDVGCGTGQLAARLARRRRRTRVVGCDFSLGMLRQARRRSRAVALVAGDACRLPFADATFDAVVSTEAFHWFPDQGAALREIRRVLRPGGLIVLVLVNPRFAATGRLLHLASRAVGEPFYWPTAREMRTRLRAAGFDVEGQERLFRLPGAMLFPPVVTVGVRRSSRATPPARRPAERKSA